MRAKTLVKGSAGGDKDIVEREVLIAEMPKMTSDQVKQYLDGNQNVRGVLAEVLGKDNSAQTIMCDRIELLEDGDGGNPDIVLTPVKR